MRLTPSLTIPAAAAVVAASLFSSPAHAATYTDIDWNAATDGYQWENTTPLQVSAVGSPVRTDETGSGAGARVVVDPGETHVAVVGSSLDLVNSLDYDQPGGHYLTARARINRSDPGNGNLFGTGFSASFMSDTRDGDNRRSGIGVDETGVYLLHYNIYGWERIAEMDTTTGFHDYTVQYDADSGFYQFGIDGYIHADLPRSRAAVGTVGSSGLRVGNVNSGNSTHQDYNLTDIDFHGGSTGLLPHPTKLFNDSLEISPAGNHPGTGDPMLGKWPVKSVSGGGSITVRSGEYESNYGNTITPYDGSHYVHLDRPDGSASLYGDFRDGPLMENGKVTFSYAQRPENGLGALVLRNGTSLVGIVTLFADEYLSTPANSVTIYGGGSGHQRLSQTMTPGEWNEVLVEYEQYSGSISVSLDGGTTWETRTNGTLADAKVDNFYFGLTAEGSSHYFDDIQVTQIPEPGTLALLLIGLVALFGLRGRRR